MAKPVERLSAAEAAAETVRDGMTIGLGTGSTVHHLLVALGRRQPRIRCVATSVATEQRIPHPASQSHVLIGMPALSRGDPDFFALTVGNYILGGGGFVSRISREVREQRGLAYSSYSYFSPMAQEIGRAHV